METNLLDVYEKEEAKIQRMTENLFVVQPLERGYGVTLGNSLRRVLLSSLEGSAVTHISIPGVAHEFSTIPGIVEDTTEIILNIKKLRLRMDGPSDTVEMLKIDAKGEGIVTAADIVENPKVQVLNPELVIAHLTSAESIFQMDLYVGKGRGYRASDKQDCSDKFIGVIPIDSIFSPVIKANYDVEDTRSLDRVDLDRLNLEVVTDGSMKPCEAISQAARILQGKLQMFTDLQMPVSGGVTEDVEGDENSSLPLDQLELSVRSNNCLKRAGIMFVGDLLKFSEDEIMKLKNCGQKSLDEIKERLAERGLSLRPSIPE